MFRPLINENSTKSDTDIFEFLLICLGFLYLLAGIYFFFWHYDYRSSSIHKISPCVLLQGVETLKEAPEVLNQSWLSHALAL